MNILLINHYAGSDSMGMEFRPYYLAKEWLKDGHKVTIVGGTYSHVRKVQPSSAGLENIDGINYIWLWTNQYSGNGIARLISMLSFVTQLLLFSFRFIWFARPNVVIASSTYPLDIFPAWVIAKLSRAKLVFEIHDLWPMSPMELGKMSKWHPFIMLMRAGEWFAYKFSDHIITMLPGVYGHIKNDGIEKGKITYIPNGVVIDHKMAKSLPGSLQRVLDNLLKQKKFIIGYAGSIGAANPFDSIIKAMIQLKKENVVLVVVGSGSELNALKQSTRSMKNIIFHDKISKEQIPLFLRQVDVGYIEFKSSKLYQYGVSANKIFDYMLAAKPIIQVLDTPHDLIKEAKCGRSISTGDLKALAKAIKQMTDMSPEKLTNMGENGRVYALERHNYKHLAEKFLKAVCKQET